jgi:hypothetical protein
VKSQVSFEVPEDAPANDVSGMGRRRGGKWHVTRQCSEGFVLDVPAQAQTPAPTPICKFRLMKRHLTMIGRGAPREPDHEGRGPGTSSTHGLGAKGPPSNHVVVI